MAKKIKTVIKLNLPAGEATPAPPVGPALGQYGVAIMNFCKAYNEKTKEEKGAILPAVITIFEDRSFEFEIKTPPASTLLLKATNIKKGSSSAGREKIGKVTKKQLEKIAEKKKKDLNAKSLESAIKIIEGTAKSMGIEIEN